MSTVQSRAWKQVYAIVLLFFASGLHGQDYIRFQRLTQEDGLVQGLITAIEQDQQGFIWIGTKGGLHRYDGYDFKVYRHDPENPDSPAADHIASLEVDGDGNLWVLGNNHQLQYFDQKSSRFIRLPAATQDYIVAHQITDMIYDERGVLWMLSFEHGLHCHTIETGKTEPVLAWYEGRPVLDENRNTLELARLKNGDLLIPVPAGHLLLQDPLGQARPLLSRLPDRDDFVVTDYLEDADGSILFNYNDAGVYRLQRDLSGVENVAAEIDYGAELLADNIDRMVRDKRGNIWMATPTGLLQWNTVRKQVVRHNNNPANPDSLLMSSAGALFLDRSETLWIGSAGKGLSMYSPFINKFRTYSGYGRDSDVGDYIYGIDSAGDSVIWAAISYGDVVCLDANTGELLRKGNLSEADDSFDTPLDCFAVSRDEAYFATLGGVYKYNHHASPRISRISPNGAAAFFSASAEEHWAAGFGLFRFYPGRDVLQPVDYTGSREIVEAFERTHIRSIVRQGEFLWMASDRAGLFRYDIEGGYLEQFSAANMTSTGWPSDNFFHIHAEAPDILWLASDTGLTRLDTSTMKTAVYSLSTGLPDNMIYSILRNDEFNGREFWLSTNQGLIQFWPDRNEHRHYTRADGLPSNEFNRGARSRLADGGLVFGGVNGLVSFKPADLTANPHPPSVAITSIKVFGRELQTGLPTNQVREIELQHDQNFLTVEFAALDFAYSANNRYRYKLERFEEEWNEIGKRRFASYTNLPPGEYAFLVQGSNNDGVWSNTPRRLALTIIPPFWKTWPFYLLVALALASVVGASHWYRTASIIKQRNLLRREVKERKQIQNNLMEHQARLRRLAAQLAIAEEQERRRIAVGMHDTVGQNLAFAKRLLNAAHNRKSVDETVRKDIEEALELVGESIAETKSLTFQLSPPVLYELGFVSAVQWLADNLLTRHGIHHELIKNTTTVPFNTNTAVLLFQSVREVLLNVVKHAEADTVTINIKVKPSLEMTVITVTDNGKGFNTASVIADKTGTSGFGLLSLRERVAYFGGTIEVDSTPGEGTKVLFYVPDTAGGAEEEKDNENQNSSR